ncbi:type IV pilus modification protein PilV [Pseudomonas sp. dw_358]|uniref:type IV pilus modification protein PilV n=1 Tax=Pseudomonas sp. dw_358 TaxID=2720083 RepID=UPI001BD3C787|nr:type IV pilus modification protein PilV [Pseudomonas sp. dw_358]
MGRRGHQGGFSLIEVMISVLILAVGLLGAAAIQLTALKYTDSSTMRSQASFIAYDMMDRIRANPDLSYALANLTSITTTTGTTLYGSPRDQDWNDFASNIQSFAGPVNGQGSSIVVTGRVVTVTVQWCDQRAMGTNDCTSAMQSFALTSRVAIDTGIK